ncbi:MAG: 2-oxo acid dehydrogenase subunit E2 [Hyphomicrobiaceae bacterium]|nr:2-oxo acid dehydrogenase subunit E2 [Hyphomicrobiaceae bacterium]
MAVEVILPKVDMDMETGAVHAWKVREGDAVRAGDVLFEISTNKAAMEVEAPASGIVRGIAAEEGATLPVGTIVAWICAPDEQPPARAEPAEVRAHVAAGGSPAPAKPAAPAGAISREPSALRATPLARRLATSLGIDLRQVPGSGPRGRIVSDDVDRHAGEMQSTVASAGARNGAVIAADARVIEAGRPRVRRVPLTAVQRIAAQRLVESVRTAPHFAVSAHIEMQALIDLRARLAPRIEEQTGIRPSLTVLLARIAGHLLPRHERINGSMEGESVCLHGDVNIGIAVDRDGELMVPVLKRAGERSLAELTAELARLRKEIEDRAIRPADLTGGTFTISNLGMYGVDSFSAIINPPESAILAVGRTVATPVGRDGQIVLVPRATFTLSCDHRLVDGVLAARFMRDLREAIEHPEVLI